MTTTLLTLPRDCIVTIACILEQQGYHESLWCLRLLNKEINRALNVVVGAGSIIITAAAMRHDYLNIIHDMLLLSRDRRFLVNTFHIATKYNNKEILGLFKEQDYWDNHDTYLIYINYRDIFYGDNKLCVNRGLHCQIIAESKRAYSISRHSLDNLFSHRLRDSRNPLPQIRKDVEERTASTSELIYEISHGNSSSLELLIEREGRKTTKELLTNAGYIDGLKNWFVAPSGGDIEFIVQLLTIIDDSPLVLLQDILYPIRIGYISIIRTIKIFIDLIRLTRYKIITLEIRRYFRKLGTTESMEFLLECHKHSITLEEFGLTEGHVIMALTKYGLKDMRPRWPFMIGAALSWLLGDRFTRSNHKWRFYHKALDKLK